MPAPGAPCWALAALVNSAPRSFRFSARLVWVPARPVAALGTILSWPKGAGVRVRASTQPPRAGLLSFTIGERHGRVVTTCCPPLRQADAAVSAADTPAELSKLVYPDRASERRPDRAAVGEAGVGDRMKRSPCWNWPLA